MAILLNQKNTKTVNVGIWLENNTYVVRVNRLTTGAALVHAIYNTEIEALEHFNSIYL